MRCEQAVSNEGGGTYGRLFRDLDMKLTNEPTRPGTTKEDMDNAVTEITVRSVCVCVCVCVCEE